MCVVMVERRNKAPKERGEGKIQQEYEEKERKVERRDEEKGCGRRRMRRSGFERGG